MQVHDMNSLLNARAPRFTDSDAARILAVFEILRALDAPLRSLDSSNASSSSAHAGTTDSVWQV